MRWSDLYVDLLATVMLFAAVVSYVSGAGWQAAILVLAAAIMFLFAGLRAKANEKMVLVGEPSRDPLYRLREAVDEAGFGLRYCPGPIVKPCPYYIDEPCPYADPKMCAAIIYRTRENPGPVAPCDEALGVPALFLVEGSLEPSSFGNGRARMGYERGPAAALETIRVLRDRKSPKREETGWEEQRIYEE